MNRRQHFRRMSDGQCDRLAGDPVLGEALVKPFLQPVRRVNGNLALAHEAMDFCDRDSGQMKGVVGVAHRSQRWVGELGLVVHQPEIGAGIQDVFHAAGTRQRRSIGVLLPAGEIAPLLRRQRLDKRRRVVRHGGTDQVTVPGKPGATGGQGHQFHRRAVWPAGNEDLVTRFRLGNDLGEFRLCFRNRDGHATSLTVSGRNATRIRSLRFLEVPICRRAIHLMGRVVSFLTRAAIASLPESFFSPRPPDQRRRSFRPCRGRVTLRC